VIDIIGNDKNIQQKIEQVQNKFKEFGKKIQQIFLTTAAIRTTFAGITVPLNQMFTAFSSFEMSMSKVKALTKGTADEVIQLGWNLIRLAFAIAFTVIMLLAVLIFIVLTGMLISSL
ncbi:MAG: hypothetical protein LBU34_05515, partial [Planctomycetaceae bacterium]|nr:hypothetical protein [Planctomycetaceae bacterium]